MRSTHKILVVEDDRQLRKALVSKLKQCGYTVHAAEDGQEGLRLTLAEQPDLLILDLLMPKMGGQEMLKYLRDDPQAKHVPVVILTNDASRESIEEATLSGAPAYFSKASTSLKEVIEIVEYHLGE